MTLQTPHLLVIEDDPTVAHVLEAALDFGGFTCDIATSGVEALQRLDRRPYDAILADLGLPDLDGMHLIKAIRFHRDVPIIVISGRAEEEHRIEALDAGADQFLPKPFLPGELLARIRSVLRRSVGRPEPVATELRLSPQEKKLLDLLESRPNQPVSADEIATMVWGSTRSKGDSHVRVLVTHLRRRLQAGGHPLNIVNQRGAGYRLEKAPPAAAKASGSPLNGEQHSSQASGAH